MPGLVIVLPRYKEYLEFSRWARRIYYQYSNLVEPFGLDECWLHVTGSLGLFGQDLALDLSKALKDHSFLTNGLQISVRDQDLFSSQYQAPLTRPCQSGELLTEQAMSIFQERYTWQSPVRALTIRAIKLTDSSCYRQVDFLMTMIPISNGKGSATSCTGSVSCTSKGRPVMPLSWATVNYQTK